MHFSRWTLVYLMAALSTAVFAQNRSLAQDRSQGRGGFSGLPEVVSRLPEIKGLDETGRVINLRELKGDYKVLVFGCLT